MLPEGAYFGETDCRVGKEEGFNDAFDCLHLDFLIDAVGEVVHHIE